MALQISSFFFDRSFDAERLVASFIQQGSASDDLLVARYDEETKTVFVRAPCSPRENADSRGCLKCRIEDQSARM